MSGTTEHQRLCKGKKVPTRAWSRAILLTLGTTVGQASAFVPAAFNFRHQLHPGTVLSQGPTLPTQREDPAWATTHSALFASSGDGSRTFTPKSPAWSSANANANANASTGAGSKRSPFVIIDQPPPRSPWGEVSLEGGVRVASGGVVPARWAVLVASPDADTARAEQARRNYNNRRPSSPPPVAESAQAGKGTARGQRGESRWADGAGSRRNLTAAQMAGDWRQRKRPTTPATANVTAKGTAAGARKGERGRVWEGKGRNGTSVGVRKGNATVSGQAKGNKGSVAIGTTKSQASPSPRPKALKKPSTNASSTPRPFLLKVNASTPVTVITSRPSPPPKASKPKPKAKAPSPPQATSPPPPPPTNGSRTGNTTRLTMGGRNAAASSSAVPVTINRLSPKVKVTRLVVVNGTARLASSAPRPANSKSNSNSNPNVNGGAKGERRTNKPNPSWPAATKGGSTGSEGSKARKAAAVAQASSMTTIKTPPKTDAQRNAGSKMSGRERVSLLLSSKGQPPSGDEVKRLINYCLRRQEWDAVLELVAAEESRTLPLSGAMLDLAIALMGRAGRTQEASQLAATMQDRGLHSGQKTRNALLAAYSLAEGPEASAKVSGLLSEMREAGQVDIVAVNTLMKAYVNKREESKALSLMEELVQWGQGLEPDLITYTTAITACGARWERALSILSEAESRLPLEALDPQLYTAAMKSCRAANRTDKVLEVYGRMTGRGHVDVVACNSVLEALRQNRDGDAALQFLQDMKKKGPQPNTVNYNTVMDTLATEGKIDQVLVVLEEMKASGSVRPNQRSYTVAMKACVAANQGERGAQLFQDMRRELKVSGDCVAYGTLIDLYASTGSLEQLRALELEIATRRGLFKDVRIYTALIRGYGVLGEWSCALRVLERMRDKGVRPTIVTYGTLMKVLGDCRRHAEASQLLKDMEADGMAATDIVYEGAASAYKSAGRLDKVLQLKWRRLTKA